jgi:ubiquinone/menaquinone biosynthesis C-methylase UbiE
MAADQMETPGERYDRDMVTAMFAPFARDLVGRTRLRGHMHIADIGCGTGIVARLLGQRLDETSTINGIDINAGMLDVARAATEMAVGESGMGNFVWHEAGAEALPLADGSMDLVVSQHAFMFFPDRTQAAREMHRVLRPGDELHISAWRDYRQQPHYAALIAGLNLLITQQAGELMKTAFQFDREEQIRTPLMSGGFQDIVMQTVEIEVRYPSAEAFVEMIVKGSILARKGIEISGQVMEKSSNFVAEKLIRFETSSGLVVPMKSYHASTTP